ncbi:helix-turn-helix transcriptional regulator [Rhodococcus opacus]|nr:helix-turn-helix transcriptional regulator [Rhodococcus opacus]
MTPPPSTGYTNSPARSTGPAPPQPPGTPPRWPPLTRTVSSTPPTGSRTWATCWPPWTPPPTPPPPHHRRHGRNGSALTAAARAQRLADTCDGARTPALAEALQPSPLTGRQREIITLAAQGLSNKQIAEKLTVSVRTVEGHLYRASLKTGLAGRDDLGATLTGDQTSARGHQLE